MDMPSSSSYRLIIQWVDGKASPHGLKVLRELSPIAKRMGLRDLSEALSGDRPFDLGIIVEHRRELMSRQLEVAGFMVTHEFCSY